MNISEWLEAGKPWNVILHGDCMDLMKHFNDKEINLSIVDPPYGIGMDKNSMSNRSSNSKKYKGFKGVQYKGSWIDNDSPDKSYFQELFRISQNQIISGANHFISKIPLDSSCWVVWYKNGQCPGSTNADCELAWTSFKTAVRMFRYDWSGFGHINAKEERFHPTQKPIALYRWILQNYAKPGDKIIDTHSGSGSLACACHLEKFDFLAIEKDEDYYKSSCERLETLRSQGVLF
jgi:site-specific DNA-methyltransferase (adenine-specific)